MSSHRLAQINFSRLRCPLTDPKMDKFVEFLQSVNALAEASPGFVWRLDEQSALLSGNRAFPPARSWSTCRSGSRSGRSSATPVLARMAAS